MGILEFAGVIFFVAWSITIALCAARRIWDLAAMTVLSLPVFGAIALGHVSSQSVDAEAMLSWLAILIYGSVVAGLGALAGVIWRNLWHDPSQPDPTFPMSADD
ncbi:hypothetical protein ACS3SW_19685 [Roseobacteraceae bacterium S113]